jgi:hypothetical protein
MGEGCEKAQIYLRSEHLFASDQVINGTEISLIRIPAWLSGNHEIASFEEKI